MKSIVIFMIAAALGAVAWGIQQIALAGPAASNVISIEASDYAFTPNSLTLKPGRVTIEVTNVGKVPHWLAILDTQRNMVVASDARGVAPQGGVERLEVTLKPGAYTFVCLPHVTEGQEGILTVEE